MHEAQFYGDNNSMVTLTYDQQHVPTNYSVDLRAFQLFMKRLRKSLPQKIRFFASGEYGDNGLRPHYHALIFNHSFPDKKLHAERRGNKYYKSKSLDALWPYGELNEITDVTYQSAAYVARYVIKKIVGDRADDHYTRISPIDGNIYRVKPEFSVMSRRPGIGTRWFDKYKSDLYPSDFLIVDGKRHSVPQFYINKLQEEEQTKLKRTRKRNGLKRRDNATPERLAVRETVQQLRADRLKRSL